MTTPRLRRREWTSTPAAAPDTLDPAVVQGLAVHWVGPPVSAAVNAGDRAAVVRYLEAIRRLHTIDRGWSDIAYQWAVDQAGRRWELRGWSRQSAANGDTDPNRRYGAVVALVGEGQEPTEDLLAALVDARADFRRHYPRATALRTHSDVRPEPTACPGPDLTRWVRSAGPDPREADMTPEQMTKALAAALKADTPLSRQFRRLVRESVQVELGQQEAGQNPPADQ